MWEHILCAWFYDPPGNYAPIFFDRLHTNFARRLALVERMKRWQKIMCDVASTLIILSGHRQFVIQWVAVFA